MMSIETSGEGATMTTDMTRTTTNTIPCCDERLKGDGEMIITFTGPPVPEAIKRMCCMTHLLHAEEAWGLVRSLMQTLGLWIYVKERLRRDLETDMRSPGTGRAPEKYFASLRDKFQQAITQLYCLPMKTAPLPETQQEALDVLSDPNSGQLTNSPAKGRKIGPRDLLHQLGSLLWRLEHCPEYVFGSKTRNRKWRDTTKTRKRRRSKLSDWDRLHVSLFLSRSRETPAERALAALRNSGAQGIVASVSLDEEALARLPASRLRVHIESNVAVLDDEPYGLRRNAAQVLAFLLRNEGKWVAGWAIEEARSRGMGKARSCSKASSNSTEKDAEEAEKAAKRVSSCIKKMPRCIRELIRRRTGRGYKLLLGGLDRKPLEGAPKGRRKARRD